MAPPSTTGEVLRRGRGGGGARIARSGTPNAEESGEPAGPSEGSPFAGYVSASDDATANLLNDLAAASSDEEGGVGEVGSAAEESEPAGDGGGSDEPADGGGESADSETASGSNENSEPAEEVNNAAGEDGSFTTGSEPVMDGIPTDER